MHQKSQSTASEKDGNNTRMHVSSHTVWLAIRRYATYFDRPCISFYITQHLSLKIGTLAWLAIHCTQEVNIIMCIKNVHQQHPKKAETTQVCTAGAYLEGGPRGPPPPQSKFFWLSLSIA